jgi:hypothetical protein
MGFCGAGNGALGRLAMIHGQPRWRSLALAAVSLSLLGGCAAIGGFVGAAAGIATSVATTNPAIGLAVGIAAQAGTNEALKTYSRRRQRGEQEAIASVVGEMNPGESREWRHAHMIGSGSDYGEVRVVRLIETPLARCKELVFSHVHGEGERMTRAWFTTTACQHGATWRWAAAEPAVDRWGNLQ